jgi:hypothetical protein
MNSAPIKDYLNVSLSKSIPIFYRIPSICQGNSESAKQPLGPFPVCSIAKDVIS